MNHATTPTPNHAAQQAAHKLRENLPSSRLDCCSPVEGDGDLAVAATAATAPAPVSAPAATSRDGKLVN